MSGSEQRRIEITVNGAPETIPAGSSLCDLLAIKGVTGRIAVEVDGAVVPRSAHAAFELEEGAAVEIVSAIGGG